MLREHSEAQLCLLPSQGEFPDASDIVASSRAREQHEFDEAYDRLDREGIYTPGDIRIKLARDGLSNWGAVVSKAAPVDRHKPPVTLK